MKLSAKESIEALKKCMGAQTDAELARKLRIDKSTVSSWKSRDSVPQRFLNILDGQSHQVIATPPIRWGEHENIAFSLALYRFSRWVSAIIESGDFRKLNPIFNSQSNLHIWLFLNDAQSDLIEAQDDGRHSMADAQTFLLLDEIDDPASGLKRDKNRLADHLKGMPKDY